MEDTTLEEIPEKVKGKPGRKPKAQSTSNTDLEEMVKTLVAQMQAGNTAGMIQLAAEMRKPTELQQKQLDEDRDKLIKTREMSVKAAKMKERVDLQKVSACRAEGHQDERGNTRFRAQINSNGYFIPMCQKCQLQTPAIKADPGQSSVDMWQWKGITEESLKNMAKQREQAA